MLYGGGECFPIKGAKRAPLSKYWKVGCPEMSGFSRTYRCEIDYPRAPCLSRLNIWAHLPLNYWEPVDAPDRQSGVPFQGGFPRSPALTYYIGSLLTEVFAHIFEVGVPEDI